MSTNISANPSFNSFKVFNPNGNYFYVDGNGNIQSSPNSILFTTQKGMILNSIDNSNLNVKNGKLSFNSENGDLILTSGSSSEIKMENTGNISLEANNTIKLTSNTINFDCQNINLDLTQTSGVDSGNLVTKAQSYTISSNDIYSKI